MSVQVRFGSYDLDLAGMELRKNGVRIRLQDQPFRILATLVSKPGQLVTREELKEKIWASDTFVDFDPSLNKAVNRLREALDDDPSQPRYIETVPRRGYRFVAPVTNINAPEIPTAAVPAAAKSGPLRRRSRLLLLTAFAAVLFIAGVITFKMVPGHRVAAPGAPRLLIPHAFDPKLSHDGKLLACTSTIGGDVPHIWVRQLNAPPFSSRRLAANRWPSARIAPRAASRPMAPFSLYNAMREHYRIAIKSSPSTSPPNISANSSVIRTTAFTIPSFPGTTIGWCSRSSSVGQKPNS